MRERSSGSDSLESLGSTFGGRPASFCSQCEGSSNAGMIYSESTPSFFAAPSLPRSASSIPAWRGPSIFAIKSEFFQIGTPSLRQYSPNAQRGRLSPGYHLPCPKCSRPPGANRVRNLRMRSSASPRLVGPTAEMFHSGDSRSSTETKVGSPPIVRRTSRGFADALDGHLEVEFDLCESDRAADWRGRAIMRRGGDGNVPLARQHPRSDVEADPAGAGKINLGPSVQIGKIALDLARSFDRIDVGAQLNEVTRDEAGGETEVPKDLDQQPRRVAARSGARFQRLLRRLDAGLHPDDVANFLLQLRIEIDQKIDRAGRLARNAREVC